MKRFLCLAIPFCLIALHSHAQEAADKTVRPPGATNDEVVGATIEDAYRKEFAFLEAQRQDLEHLQPVEPDHAIGVCPRFNQPGQIGFADGRGRAQLDGG